MDPANVLYDALLAFSQASKTSVIPPGALRPHIGQKLSIARLHADGRIVAVWPDGTIVLRPPNLYCEPHTPPPQVIDLVRQFMAHVGVINHAPQPRS